MRLPQAAFALLSSVALISCASAPTAPSHAQLEAAAAAKLQALPPASPERFPRMNNMKQWRNPYLVILPEGVGLLDPANNEQRLLKSGEVLEALAALPPSAWPYGRVVAVTENSLRSTEEQKVAIRRNRGIVAGTLEGAHVLINLVPPS